ncbi:MAG TPA: hypothetical protein VLZ77_07425 [Acidimicrobiales bacterium]|nr:hypothetical protein [Acidimicrobiales bacterium]
MTDTPPTTPGDPVPGQAPPHPPAGGPPGWGVPPGYAPPGYPPPGYGAVPPPPAGRPSPSRWRKVAVGIGAAAGVAVGAAALAGAATSGGTGAPDATVTDSGSTSTTPSTTTPSAPGPRAHGRFGAGGPFGGLGGIGGPFGGVAGPGIYGQETVQGPNGYETIAHRTGTVSDVSNPSGSTWSLTVKSADGTSATFTVDSSTSVNGGEMGIGSVKNGDTVTVVALVSGSTSTAKSVTDQTVLKANGNAWRPTGPMPGPMGGSGSSSSGSTSSSGSST